MKKLRNTCKKIALIFVAISVSYLLVIARPSLLEKPRVEEVKTTTDHNLNQIFHIKGLESHNLYSIGSEEKRSLTQEKQKNKQQSALKTEKHDSRKTEDVIMHRFRKRPETLLQSCIKHQEIHASPHCEIQNAGLSMKYVNDSKIVYCAIEKTGSTFWKRILHIVGGWGNGSKPSSILTKHANSKHGGFQTLQNKTIDAMKAVTDFASSIMFVRDPYTKLFSAWLDKLYSPNHYYWKYFSPLVKHNQGFLNQTLKCASDISFSEFLNHILNEIETKECVDPHFAPNFKHCLPCSLQFEFIGKYETLKEDTLYLLNHLNISHMVTFDDFEQDAVIDAIRDSADWAFSNKKQIEECGVTFHCALFKTWKRLQSRGIFSKHLEFPYKGIQEVQNITEEDFRQALLTANKGSNTSNTNRKEAIQQAYSMLPKHLIKSLIKVFDTDFDMFEYERIHDFITDTETRDHEYFPNCPDLTDL